MPGAVLRSLWRERSLPVLRGMFREISAIGNPSQLMDYGQEWTADSWAAWARDCACVIGVAETRLAGCFVLDFQSKHTAVLHVVRIPGIAADEARWFWDELRRMYPGVALVAHLAGPLRRHARIAARRHGFHEVLNGRFVLKGQ